MTSSPVGYIAALAGLEHMNPRRLRNLLNHHEPEDAFQRLATGKRLDPMFVRSISKDGALTVLRGEASRASPDASAALCEKASVRVIASTDPAFPAQFLVDPDPPAVLFVRGELTTLESRRVGIIGTRNATAAGRATATELGGDLASEGVAVVSGLARGIDAAAHRGVRDRDSTGRAIAVVGNGVDLPYPKQNSGLWEWVATEGLLISEWPPGTTPEPWHFPLRNRILAALCEVLVVIESREKGGSLITVRLAAERGIDVMAVPGSPHSRASAGTNQLLVDGAGPVTSSVDVLSVLGIDHRRQSELPFDPRPSPGPDQLLILDICGSRPCTLDMLVAGTGLSVGDAAIAAARLEVGGWLHEAGGWFEPAGSRLIAR